jgi:hypothetical protein
MVDNQHVHLFLNHKKTILLTTDQIAAFYLILLYCMSAGLPFIKHAASVILILLNCSNNLNLFWFLQPASEAKIDQGYCTLLFVRKTSQNSVTRLPVSDIFLNRFSSQPSLSYFQRAFDLHGDFCT